MKVYAVVFDSGDEYGVECICSTEEIAERERLEIINDGYPTYIPRKVWESNYYIEEFKVITE